MAHFLERGSSADAAAGPAKLIMARRWLLRWSRCSAACLGRTLDCIDACIKILGPCFVLLALGLFGFETYTFFAYVMPSRLEDGIALPQLVLEASTGVFLLLNMLYNYVMAVCVSPGAPPADDEGGCQVLDEELGWSMAAQQCPKCYRQKPPRAHHCSVCGRCVLKMDHHCPWINNCVGFYNYRYFCLFLLYLGACCVFVSVMFLEEFAIALLTPRQSRFHFAARQCVALSWIVASCIFLGVALLGGFHLYLVLTNQTTIEFHTNTMQKDRAKKRGEYFRNPYDVGRKRNFQQVFGPHNFCGVQWLMPYAAEGPSGDGTCFPSVAKLRA